MSAGRVDAAGAGQAPDAVDVALEQASDTGARVEIPSQETEFSTSFANPTGTITTELSSTPVRVQQDGDWVPVDYDLTVADGQVVPKEGDTDVAFSDGGDRDLVGVQAGSQASLDVDWLHDLPTPTLAGNTATYAEVLPGVDLIMTAIPGGYTEVLKVKNAAAAADPALNELRFPTEVQGDAAMNVTSQGGLKVSSDDGSTLLVSNAPTMWDSSGATHGAGLGEGDRSADMQVDISRDAVTVTPDQGLLDAASTQYPVYIDPDIHNDTGNRNHWLMVEKGASSAWDWSNDRYVDNYGEGVGFQNYSGTSTKRLFWVFGLPGSKFPTGSHVENATFQALETHASSCTPRNVFLDKVPAGSVKSSTTWANQPGQTNSGNLASNDTQVYPPGTCANAPKYISFSSADLIGAVQHSLNDDSEIDLRLTASETDPLGWKRFYNSATLSIEFNRAPTAPNNLDYGNAPTGHSDCGSYIPFSDVNDMPRMRAVLHDPDGDRMKAAWDFDRWNGSSWVQKGQLTTLNGSGNYWADGGTATGDINKAWVKPNSVWDEARYRFTVQGVDDYTAGDTSDGCGFFLDAQDPQVAESGSIENGTTHARTPLDPEVWLSTGDKLHVLADPLTSGWGSSNEYDVSSYQLTFDNPQWNTTVTAPSTRSVADIAIPLDGKQGEHWVKVMAIDRSGRTSAITPAMMFRVQSAVEITRYNFDEGSGTTVGPWASSQVQGPSFTLAGGTSFLVDPRHPGDPTGSGELPDTYLHFDGVSGAANATSRALDTSSAFSVSAYVHPASVASRQVVASQSGAQGQSFVLALVPGCGAACVTFTMTDQATGTTYTATSTASVTTSGWYVVGGSYDDAGHRRIDTWVGSQQAGDQNVTVSQTHVDLPGTFVPRSSTAASMGRDLAGGFLNGDLEDVRFYTDELAVFDVNGHVLTDDPNLT